jgi:3',5'-cyclic AMP phosphodiesterase CpdA
VSALLQISDPHFGTEQPDAQAALLQLAERLRPELVILSGDITQRARRSQFARARNFVDRLTAPLLAIPGNHDIPLFNFPARLFAPYANYARAFGNDLQPQYESDAFLATGVNTTRPARHKDGEVSRDQAARVARQLRTAAREQLRIVVVHQPVLALQAEDEKNLLHGRADAVRAWTAAGADIIMGGHIHLPYVRPIDAGIVRSRRRLWAVQAGTALSSRVRGNVPNSVNVVRHAPGDLVCSVERWDFDAASAEFRCVQVHVLDLSRDRRDIRVRRDGATLRRS